MSADKLTLPTGAPLYRRIAFRDEGDFVNAYFAHLGSMESACFISSMRRELLVEDPDLWEAWRGILAVAYRAYCLRHAGVDPGELEEKVGPAHERTGRA